MLKKIFATLLLVCPLVFANWDGSVKKPSIREIDGKEFFEIATPENLAWFAVQVNKGKLNYNAVLVNDIVVWDSPVSSETTPWIPIGIERDTDLQGFKGVFDGNGYKVSGVYINSELYGKTGFFGVIGQGAVVKNLTIENASIQGGMTTASYSGGIAGVFSGDSIINCEFHGSVKDSIAGGLVGKAEVFGSKEGRAVAIRNSRNYGNVESLYYGGGLVAVADGGKIIACENFGNVTGGMSGGLIGITLNARMEDSRMTKIDSCANHAIISTTTKYGYSGGIAAEIYKYSRVSIQNTVNDGEVYSGADSARGYIAGGFVALMDGSLTIEKCENNGIVSLGKNIGSGIRGGFVGYASGDSLSISGSINKSNLTGSYVGGFVAYTSTLVRSLNIYNSINEGNFDIQGVTANVGGFVGYINAGLLDEGYFRNVVNKGNILYRGSFGGYFGGIVGRNLVDDNPFFNLIVDKANNYGNIDVSLDAAADNSVYAGGIIGMENGGLLMTRCLNKGNISYVENTHSSTYSYLGGLMGRGAAWNSLAAGPLLKKDFTTEIESSTNTGDVIAKAQYGKSKSFVSGIATSATFVRSSINEGRVELVGNEQILDDYSFVSGIIYAGTAINCVNKGNIFHHWSVNYDDIAAILKNETDGQGNYSIADSVMINAKMVVGVSGCNFVDKNKLGLKNISDNSALTTDEMQTVEFAWRLNTCDGTEKNTGAWSQKGKDYPVLVGDSLHAIYKVSFWDTAKVLNVKNYTLGSSYTDYKGHVIDMPEGPDPSDADEDLKFGYWGLSKLRPIFAESIIHSDSSLYAYYVDKNKDPIIVSFIVDGIRVADHASTGNYLTMTLPDAQKSGCTFLGWYDGETLVGEAKSTKKFTAGATLTAKFKNLYYTVQFFDQGIVLQSDKLIYGDLPKYKGEIPQYKDYDFVGWTPEITAVTDDVVYFADFVDRNSSSSVALSSSSAASSSSARSSSSAKSSSSQLPMSSFISHGQNWVVDALGGVGNFDSTKSLKGWTLRGGGLVENDDGAYVLQLMSDYSGREIYEIQAKYPVYLQKGHSYKIKGLSYPYDDLSWDTVFVGLMALDKSYSGYAIGIPDEYHVYFEYKFKLGGAFESGVYNHCDDSRSGEFYINGGARLGGFAIEKVVVEEREISCPGTVYASQIGFQKDGFKELVVEYGSDEPVKFVDESGNVALTVPIGKMSGYMPSNQWVRLVDFSKLTTNGTYAVVQGKDTIYKNLVVTSNAYGDLLKGVLKFYYYHRASMTLDEKYAGVYARAGGHPDTVVYLHSSTGEEGTIVASKGWYDAGDYGKYTVNAGVSTYTLLSLYERFPKYFDKLKWNIPADGNLPDLLAEIKYSLDWMLMMQSKDGSVFHKLSGLDFPNTVMPVRDEYSWRYVIGKSVTAAYDFAAVMAAASRVYKGFDASYAKRCLDAAELAYRWAENHPKSLYLANPAGVKTGAYEDADASDEQQFAATELYVTTGNPAYKMDGSSGVIPSWQNVYGLATYAKSVYKVDFGTGAYTDLVATADRLVQNASTGFGIPMQPKDFVWGSNGVAANQGMWLLNAYYLTGKEEYYNTAVRTLDYLVGKNPLRMSYVTGFGTKSPQNPHHRISQADGVKAPVPGMLVGGPQNNDNSDKSSECSYTTSYPAISYYDNDCSYTTNEVAINWNAPLAYLAGALEALASGETPTFAQIPAYSASSSSFVASSSSAKSSSSAQVVSSSSAKSSSSAQVVSSSSAKSSSSAQVVSSSSAKSSSSAQVVSSSSAKSSSSVASSSSVKSSSSRVPSSSSMVPSSSAKSSSSSKNSSSSKAVSSSSTKSSSSAKSSSSSKAKSSSSKKTNVVWNTVQPTFNLTVNGMSLILSNTQGGVVRIFDALGHLVVMKPLDETMTSITLQTPGNYIVRVNGMNRSVTLR